MEHHRLATGPAEALALSIAIALELVGIPRSRLLQAQPDALWTNERRAEQQPGKVAENASDASDEALHRLPQRRIERLAAHAHRQPRRSVLGGVAGPHLEQRLRAVSQRDEGAMPPAFQCGKVTFFLLGWYVSSISPVFMNKYLLSSRDFLFPFTMSAIGNVMVFAIACHIDRAH